MGPLPQLATWQPHLELTVGATEREDPCGNVRGYSAHRSASTRYRLPLGFPSA